MRHGDEPTQVLEWLYAVLSTDPTLAELAGVDVADLPGRTWPDVAPADVAEPFQVYSVAESLDQVVLGGDPRVFTTVPVIVRWVTRADQDTTAGPAQRRQYELLHGARNVPVADGGVILTVRRTAALDYPEEAAGTQYRSTGGRYVAEVN